MSRILEQVKGYRAFQQFKFKLFIIDRANVSAAVKQYGVFLVFKRRSTAPDFEAVIKSLLAGANVINPEAHCSDIGRKGDFCNAVSDGYKLRGNLLFVLIKNTDGAAGKRKRSKNNALRTPLKAVMNSNGRSCAPRGVERVNNIRSAGNVLVGKLIH